MKTDMADETPKSIRRTYSLALTPALIDELDERPGKSRSRKVELAIRGWLEPDETLRRWLADRITELQATVERL